MESISVFDIFKIGVGPSSSHTMGPWRAAQRFLHALRDAEKDSGPAERIRIELFGSLARPARHGTDVAVLLGLSGEDPVTCETNGIRERAESIKENGRLPLRGERTLPFDADVDLLFYKDRALPFHANALTFTALLGDGSGFSRTYYSVGGGFVVEEDESPQGARAVTLPHPVCSADDLRRHAATLRGRICDVAIANERSWRPDEETRSGVLRIARVMTECAYRGCHTEGVLPGGLGVARRAAALQSRLLRNNRYSGVEGWLREVERSEGDFQSTLKWVSAFALAVNEENADFGRVVTAPTNGAAGVIPAVLLYAMLFCDEARSRGDDGIVEFLLTAAEIGALFKKGATISAAMGGCQAEIGVSSAMAAAGLTAVLGGGVDRVLMAAEIAMEHHLGMTCDPIAGLVQVPCIERNTMGAMKAITAANIALESDPSKAKVSLDGVIKTMWETAKDMGAKYKETAEGGLAVNVPVTISEC